MKTDKNIEFRISDLKEMIGDIKGDITSLKNVREIGTEDKMAEIVPPFSEDSLPEEEQGHEDWTLPKYNRT